MDTANGLNDDAWKIFNRDNEAGRLLSRLYGAPPPPPRVSYPRQRRRRTTTVGDTAGDDVGGGKPWKTTYTVRGWNKAAEEERERERKENIARALSLPVPKVGRCRNRHTIVNAPAGDKVDHIPRRKTALDCRTSVDEALHKSQHYRPPRSNDMTGEKQKLQDSGKPPDIVKTSARRSERTNAARMGTMFDQIYLEIMERREHQMALEEIGSGEATRESTAREIGERLEHLRHIDPQRALAVVQKLQPKHCQEI